MRRHNTYLSDAQSLGELVDEIWAEYEPSASDLEDLDTVNTYLKESRHTGVS